MTFATPFNSKVSDSTWYLLYNMQEKSKVLTKFASGFIVKLTCKVYNEMADNIAIESSEKKIDQTLPRNLCTLPIVLLKLLDMKKK